MLIQTRKYGSQRASKPRQVAITENWGGQGGSPDITFYDKEHQVYISIIPETDTDAKLLMSHAHIVAHNFEDERLRKGGNHES